MAKDIKIGKWSSTLGDVYGNVDGGFPLVVFNADMDTALVLSPATTFMSATQYSFKDEQTNETVMTFGPMSSIDKVSWYSLFTNDTQSECFALSIYHKQYYIYHDSLFNIIMNDCVLLLYSVCLLDPCWLQVQHDTCSQ